MFRDRPPTMSSSFNSAKKLNIKNRTVNATREGVSAVITEGSQGLLPILLEDRLGLNAKVTRIDDCSSMVSTTTMSREELMNVLSALPPIFKVTIVGETDEAA